MENKDVKQVKMDIPEEITEKLCESGKKKIDGWKIVDKVMTGLEVAAVLACGAAGTLSSKHKVRGFYLGTMAGVGCVTSSRFVVEKGGKLVEKTITYCEKKMSKNK